MSKNFPDITAFPSVSFDIRLGKQLSYIDFDYVGYAEYLHKKGLTDDQIETGNIHVGALPLHSVIVGSYNISTRDIYVGIKRYNSEKRINFIFSHETEHKVDDLTGSVSEEDVIFQNKMIRKFKVGMIALGGGGAGLISGEILKSGAISLGGLLLVGAGVIFSYRSGHAYESSAHEKKAFALKNKAERFIHVSR